MGPTSAAASCELESNSGMNKTDPKNFSVSNIIRYVDVKAKSKMYIDESGI